MKALAQSCPDQRGSGEFPATIVKIALSKHIISTTMEDAELSGSQKSKEEPQFQQDASANEPLLAGRFVIREREISGVRLKTVPVGLGKMPAWLNLPYRPLRSINFVSFSAA